MYDYAYGKQCSHPTLEPQNGNSVLRIVFTDR